MAYTSFTWATVRERLTDRVGKKPFWDATEALIAFNEGLRLYNLLTGFWRTRTIITTTTSYFVQIPTILLYRVRMEFNGLAMSPSSREDLNQSRFNWRLENTASGGGVPTRPVVFAPVSLSSVYIWPADAVGGNTLLIDGVAATPVLVDDGDFVDLGEEQFDILIGYALHALSFKKQGQYFSDTIDLFKAFLKACAEENDQLKTSSLYRRVMGLDRRDLKPLRGTPTLLDQEVGRTS